MTTERDANLNPGSLFPLKNVVLQTDIEKQHEQQKSLMYTNNSAAVGTWNVSAIATNANGSVMRSWTWKVIYNFDDFLPPINTDVSSVFKLGSIVPIKFQLRDANGNYITSAVARLNFTKIISNITGTKFKVFCDRN